MARASDDERRRVAERLREYGARPYPNFNVAFIVCAMGIDLIEHLEKRHGDSELFARLADLIDPDTTCDTTKRAADTTKCVCDATATHTDASATCDMSQSRRDAVACDREALLALALEIKRSYVFGGMDADELVVSRGAAYAIARRIYDACLGVPE